MKPLLQSSRSIGGNQLIKRNIRTRGSHALLLSLVTFSALAGLRAYGADTQWTGAANSNWGTPNNWVTLAVPLPAESVQFGTLGTLGSAVLGAPFTQAGLTIVADVSTTISGAALTLDNGGVTPITVAGTHTIGAPLVIPSGATLAEPDALSQLTLTGGLSGGSLTKSGDGTLAFSGGSSSMLSIQNDGGTLTVAPGTALSLTSTNDSLGLRGNTAKLLMSGGTLDLSGRWRLANDGAVAIATITGGTITHTGSNVDIGFNQGMAVLTFGGTANYQGAGRDLQLSVANYCNTYSVFKGSAIAEFGGLNINFTNGGANQYGMINVSDSASLTGTSMTVGVDQNQSNSNVSVATVNQTGGTVTVNGIVKLAGDNRQLSPITGTTGLQGTYNLAGGTLTTQQIVGGGAGVGGQARLNFHGGTLAINASASIEQAASFVSLTNDGTDGKAYVYQNSTIATGSQSVTINQPLLAPTGQGVSSIAVSAAGSGYSVPPAVRITRAVGDTTGTGATARAEVNPTTGAITGITITNPGTDYTLPPAVALDRGNGSGAALATLSNQLVNTGSLGAASNTVRFDGLAGQAGALAGDANPAFNTIQQIVKVPYSAALNPNGPFTIEAWLKPASITAGNFTCALSSGQFGDPRSGWLIYQDQANGWNFRTYAQNGLAAATTITGKGLADADLTVDTWYHVVASWDGSKSRIYVNGELKATSADATFVPSAGGAMNFGSRADDGFAWDGSIDEVAFYNTALSGTVIANHYTNGNDAGRATPYQTLIQASSPLGYWRGDAPVTGVAGVAIAANSSYNGGLTKIGSGPLNLGLGNTYRGDTKDAQNNKLPYFIIHSDVSHSSILHETCCA
jgi:hypothetical protein